jgi:hypothetical protein
MAETIEELRARLDAAMRTAEARELLLYVAEQRHGYAKSKLEQRFGSSLGVDAEVSGRLAELLARRLRTYGELEAGLVQARSALLESRAEVRSLLAALALREQGEVPS